jgi:hypothetical protein
MEDKVISLIDFTSQMLTGLPCPVLTLVQHVEWYMSAAWRSVNCLVTSLTFVSLYSPSSRYYIFVAMCMYILIIIYFANYYFLLSSTDNIYVFFSFIHSFIHLIVLQLCDEVLRSVGSIVGWSVVKCRKCSRVKCGEVLRSVGSVGSVVGWSVAKCRKCSWVKCGEV